jgi:uncharacterized protein (TIGR02301 family)
LAASPAVAQKATPTPQPSVTPSTQESLPPYESQMLRLAQIMGALSLLRDLCGDGDGAQYRAKFAALMDAEATTPARKSAWAGAFNQSYEDYRLTYANCTPNARAAIQSFLAEADDLATALSDRYGR